MLLWRAIFLVLLMLLSWFGWQLYAEQQLMIQRLQQDQKTLNQQLGDLNDRLVAVARMQAQPVSLSVEPNLAVPEQAVFIRQNIRQALLLAQAALVDGRQGRCRCVTEYSNFITKSCPAIACPSLSGRLTTSDTGRSSSVRPNRQLRQTARQSMDRALLRIQQQLDQMARQGGCCIPRAVQSLQIIPPSACDQLAGSADPDRGDPACLLTNK